MPGEDGGEADSGNGDGGEWGDGGGDDGKGDGGDGNMRGRRRLRGRRRRGGQVPGDPGDDQCQLILDECLGANLPPDLCKEEFLSCIEGN